MRFKLGIAVGFAAGYWVATTSAEERREKLDELLSGVRENPRVSRVTETVTKDARRLGDAVEQRFAKVADGAVGDVCAGDRVSLPDLRHGALSPSFRIRPSCQVFDLSMG